ncbi:MAG: hypothetical protein LUC91_07835 [Prevotella sp.]|nr:hypothetical protein [Prevotella sp.]
MFQNILPDSCDSRESRQQSKEVIIMNATQKLHQAKLSQWAVLIQEQSQSGLTVKDWCRETNHSLNAYNYWKHLLKSECIDAQLPEIVPISLPEASPDPLPLANPSVSRELCDSRDSRNSCDLSNSYNPNSMLISAAGIDISISPSVPDDLVLGLIKAVRHA